MSKDFNIVEMKGISKSFCDIKVLDKITFSVTPRDIHARASDNGTGESTLRKILQGVNKTELSRIGTLVGIIFGAFLVGLINNGLILAGLPVSQQQIIQSLIIIIIIQAVALAKKE